MKFLEKGKTIFESNYIFNEVDKKPKVNDVYINSLGCSFLITDVIELYGRNCYYVEIDGEAVINAYFKD